MILTLIDKLEPYELSKAEVLMISNLRPTTSVLLDVIVEECDERFSEEQQEGILGVIRDVLGGEEEEEGEGEEGDVVMDMG